MIFFIKKFWFKKLNLILFLVRLNKKKIKILKSSKTNIILYVEKRKQKKRYHSFEKIRLFKLNSNTNSDSTNNLLKKNLADNILSSANEISSLSSEEFYLKKAKNFYSSYSKLYEINQITINLASPDRIKYWAEKILPNQKIIGRVTNANTLHYKTFKPQKSGLFCERIFGPLKDFECACGKSQKKLENEWSSQNNIISFTEESVNKTSSSQTSSFNGKDNELNNFNKINYNLDKFPELNSSEQRKFCPKCDVEYTWSVTRRYQLGYIQLIAPVTHIWYLKGTPSYLSLLLNLKKKDLEAIIYCSESMTLEAAWNHKFVLSESPSTLFKSWQKMGESEPLFEQNLSSNFVLNSLSEKLNIAKENFLNLFDKNGQNFVASLKNNSNSLPTVLTNYLLPQRLKNWRCLLKFSFGISFQCGYIYLINRTGENNLLNYDDFFLSFNIKNNKLNKISNLVPIKNLKESPLIFYIFFKLQYLTQKTSLFIFIQQIWKEFYKRSYLLASKKVAQMFKKTSFCFSKFIFLAKLKNQLNSSDFHLRKNKKNFQKSTIGINTNYLLKQKKIKKPKFVKIKVNFLNSKNKINKLSDFYKSKTHAKKRFFIFFKRIQFSFKKLVLYSLFNFKFLPKYPFVDLKNLNIKKLALLKGKTLSHKILNESKPLIKLLSTEIGKKMFQFELKSGIKQKYLEMNCFKNLQNSTKQILIKNDASYLSFFKENLMTSWQTQKQKVNYQRKNAFKVKTTKIFKSEKDKKELFDQKILSSVFNFTKNLFQKVSKKKSFIKKTSFKNDLFQQKRKNLKIYNFRTNLNKNQPKGNFLKILHEKKIFNNIYSLSYSFNWKKEKDWRSFFFYISGNSDYEDHPISNYKNRIPNFETSSLVGAGIVQKLLEEFNVEEIKKMDKQNRIQLYEFTQEMNELKKFVRLGLADKTDELHYREIFQERNKLIRRLKLTRVLSQKKSNPESMILSTLPVLPPDLRPIIKIEGQIAASDLNRFYQKILYRNERLKKFLKDPATRNSYEMKFTQRLLQESVDNLISNGKGKVSAEKDSRGRPLKSLSDILKGKEGRFRQHLLGKRVDYSGRSVIVVGPKLKIHQCGLPKEMAFELFLPFLLKRLIHSKMAQTVIGAKNILQTNPTLSMEILNEVMQNHPILLNRAPTLHRLGFQAFQAKLVEGRAILLHPLVCPAFNADFDGDQMAVHVPITVEARAEAWKLMFSRGNLLSPATGDPILLPSQDMVLGIYYLTTESLKYQQFSNIYFSTIEQVMRAYYHGTLPQKLHFHSIIWLNLMVSSSAWILGTLPHAKQSPHRGGKKLTPYPPTGGKEAIPPLPPVGGLEGKEARGYEVLQTLSQGVRKAKKTTQATKINNSTGRNPTSKNFSLSPFLNSLLAIPEAKQFNEILENDHNNEEPIELRVEKKGYWSEISKNIQLRSDSNNRLISRYVRTTVGRIIFNLIIQDCLN